MNGVPQPRYEGTFRLPDGRRLGYAEYGPADGRAILWFHGTPGGRRQIAPEARRLAQRRKVRLIAIERPGIGDSTSHSYASLEEWTGDIRAFCDAKGIDRFAVCGLSGGGPYALACAHYLADRVVAVTVLGGVAPTMGEDAAEGGVKTLVRTLAPVTRRLRSPLNRALVALVKTLESHVDLAISLFAYFMPPGDKAMFEDAELRWMFEDDILLGARQQMQAALHDVEVFASDWGFRLGDIRVPVYLLYGDADNIVPLRHGEHIAARLPNAELRVRPGEGHLGGLGAAREVFDDLLSHWPAARRKPAAARKPAPRRKPAAKRKAGSRRRA